MLLDFTQEKKWFTEFIELPTKVCCGYDTCDCPIRTLYEYVLVTGDYIDRFK